MLVIVIVGKDMKEGLYSPIKVLTFNFHFKASAVPQQLVKTVDKLPSPGRKSPVRKSEYCLILGYSCKPMQLSVKG